LPKKEANQFRQIGYINNSVMVQVSRFHNGWFCPSLEEENDHIRQFCMAGLSETCHSWQESGTPALRNLVGTLFGRRIQNFLGDLHLRGGDAQPALVPFPLFLLDLEELLNSFLSL